MTNFFKRKSALDQNLKKKNVQCIILSYRCDLVSTSAVTVPISIQCLENNLNMEKHVTRVVLPIAATLTLTGTALYEAVAAIFVAQIHNIDLSGAQVIIIRWD